MSAVQRDQAQPQARRSGADEAKRDLAAATAWLAGSGAVAWVLAAGHPLGSLSDALTTVGRVAGAVVATTIMTQLLLIARVPWVERRIGHDRAALLHARLGRIGFLVLIGHMVMITLGYATRVNDSVTGQLWAFATQYGGEMVAALIAFVLLLIVVVTSLAALRSKWRYERWHTVHLLVYVAVGLSLPHQLELGTTFSGSARVATDTAARVYWIALWTIAIGSFLTFRLLLPALRARRDGLRVVSVEVVAKDTVAVDIAGPGVARMRAKAGQFLLWRFLAKGMWNQAHPYSLSAAPDGRRLRITVKGVGDASRALARLTPGVRVVAEGPLGRFTLEHAGGEGLVLVAAGSGVSPILSLLADAPAGQPVTVIVRASSEAHVPHLDELRSLAAAKGAQLHLLPGARGGGWLPAGHQGGIGVLAPQVALADVYVCGPRVWAEQVLADAAAAGAAKERLHVEEFAW